jgi:hypothetical protein
MLWHGLAEAAAAVDAEASPPKETALPTMSRRIKRPRRRSQNTAHHRAARATQGGRPASRPGPQQAWRHAFSDSFLRIDENFSAVVAGQKVVVATLYSTWKTGLPAAMNGLSVLHSLYS